MDPFSAETLLRLPVRLRGIDVGHAVDVILDPDAARAIGIDVRCKDGQNRFLPVSAASIGAGEIAVSSALTLLAADELAFYRKRTSSARLLRGAPVTQNGVLKGMLHDILLREDGTVEGLVLHDGTRVPVGETVRIGADPRSVGAA